MPAVIDRVTRAIACYEAAASVWRETSGVVGDDAWLRADRRLMLAELALEQAVGRDAADAIRRRALLCGHVRCGSVDAVDAWRRGSVEVRHGGGVDSG